MTDCLVEVDRKDLPKLKELYTPDGSKSYIAYTTIDNYIRWFEQNPNVKHINIFCLNGNFDDGTFVVTDRFIAYADTINESYDRLNRLLQLIDYSKGYIFQSIRVEIRPIIRDALAKANVQVIADDTGLLYHLSKEEALKFDVQPPEGIELRPLTNLKDYEKVNSVWPHRNPNSLTSFQRMGKYNPHIGAFTTDGTLVAWQFRSPVGLLTSLQTDENYLHRGYALLVKRYVSKMIAKMGCDIYSSIIESNIPSRSLSSKLGFRPVAEVYWIVTKLSWSPDDE